MDLTGIGSLADLVGKVLERVSPDPTQRAAQQLELVKITQTGELAQLASDTDLAKGQLAINAVEAANPSIFVSGWRPGCGWLCVAALGYVAILEPIARFAAMLYGYKGAFPVIDTSTTFQVLLGMLGLAGFRSFDKKNGVAAK